VIIRGNMGASFSYFSYKVFVGEIFENYQTDLIYNEEEEEERGSSKFLNFRA
jgi:hypothetical protein